MKAALCPGSDTLAALLENEPAPDSPEWIEHLETCVCCREKLAELAADHSTWEEAARRLPRVQDSWPRQGQPTAGEPALRRIIAQLKEAPPFCSSAGETVTDEELSLSFLRQADRPGLLGQLGSYEVQEVIGRGGMGIVFKAFDPKLQRLVAIKVLAPQMAGSVNARKRFLREGRAAATISHENVIAIHEVNETAGVPYLVMQYVQGPSLQEMLDRMGPLPMREIVRIGLQIAEGLAAAHEQGLVHRDVKPANILLEPGIAGRVKITDFGLARAVDEDASCTRSGMIAGTPDYAAPEQARAEKLDARADLFSLGSVLYALCTGQPPFRGGSALAVLRRVSDETAPRVRSVNPEIPIWLEEIVTTLHARKPWNRFGSAVEVAALLGQHLAHLQQPTAVPRPPLLARRCSFARLRRMSACRLLIAVAVLGVVTLGVTGVAGPPGPGPKVPIAQAPTAKVAAAPAPKGGRIIDTTAAVWLGHAEPIACGAVTPDGKTVISGSWDGSIKIWDVAGNKERKSLPGVERALRALAVSPDGETFATAARDRVVRVWDTESGTPKAALRGHAGRILGLAYSPDGKTLASAGGDFNRAGELKLWDLAAGKERVLIGPFKRELWRVAYAPDGKSVAVAVGDGTAQLVDTKTGKVTATFQHAAYVRRVAFSPDGKLLAVSYADEGYVQLWELPGGKQRSSFQAHAKPLYDMEFSRDGKQLLTASGDGTAVSWDVSKQQVRPLFTLKGHKWSVWFAAFFPDGKTVATGGDDKTIRLWNVAEE